MDSVSSPFKAKAMASTQTVENETQTMMNDWLNSIETLLKSVDHNYIQSFSISIVPEELKNSSNQDAYMPRVVSIGPKFKGSREDLLLMEEVKLRSMLSLFHRGKQGEPKIYLEKCSNAISLLDKQVRASYVFDIKLENNELAKIMLVDGCFLLELMIAKGLDSELESRLEPPGPALEVLKDEDVLSDLMLLENQIPILVIHKLSQILFPDVFDPTDRTQRVAVINDLVLSVFSYSNVSNPEAPHILDLIHFSVNSRKNVEIENVENAGNHVVGIMDKNKKLKLKLKRCASRLVASGVCIKVLEDNKHRGISCFGWMRNFFGGGFIKLGNMLVVTNEIDKQVDDMTDEQARGFDFEFKFEKGKLEIAKLHITKTTKAKWRNVIAWEHHKMNRKSTSMISGHESVDENLVSISSPSGKFTFSSLIFDGLICCVDDVKLLKEKNIIIDHLKMNDEELEEYFHTMSFGVDCGVVDSSYEKMVDELNNYSEAFFVLRILKILWHLFKFRLEWLVKFLKQNYNFVAALVAVLTLVQTVYTVLAYYK